MRLPPVLQAWQSETPHFTSDYGRLIAVEQQPVATVACPSGKLVAVDPYTLLWEENAVPFERQVEPGQYPVILISRDGEIVST